MEKQSEVLPWMVDAANEIDHNLGLPRHNQAVTLAAEIRELLTAAMHGQELPEGVACHLSPALRAAATPAACHLLTGKKIIVETVIAAIIDAP